MNDVLMILKTLGLNFDDRVRKESLSLKNIGLNVKIIVNEQGNESHKGFSNYGIKYKAIRLLSRDILPHKKFLIIKALEMYLLFAFYIIKDRPKILYLHNLEMEGLIYLGHFLKKIGWIKAIIWDQHELPVDRLIESNNYLNRFKKNIDKCDLIVGANQERIELLSTKLDIRNLKLLSINNYMDSDFFNQEKVSLPDKVLNWLGGSQFIFASSPAEPGRYLRETIEAVLKIENLKFIVIGPTRPNVEEEILREFGEIINEKVYFVGLVPQFEIVNYLDHALASIIFYATDEINLKLCAPNRLYQAICRGIPVLCGDNPPLKSVVNKYSNGISINSDGRDSKEIEIGLNKLLHNHSNFSENAEKVKNIFVWENQIDKFKQIAELIN